VDTLEKAPDIKAFAQEVRKRANAQFETPQYKRLLSIPLTEKRAQVYVLQKAFWNINRRDCWAFAQALAPMDVKQLVWAHEEDELAGSKTRGVENHYMLQVRQSKEIHLTLDDFMNAAPREGTRTCIYAWVHLVKDSPWLKAIGACSALEVSNSAEWVAGGGMSYRWGKKMEKDLGIPFEKQLNAKEHAEVDVEHAHMLMDVARKHAKTQRERDLIWDGLIESWQLDQTWKGILADMLAELPGPK
jgi:pyrroloquinoline quinone (PQQ) biosynthesis protein C